MTNYENEILTRLMNGEDANAIAEELINSLNGALKTKNDQEAKQKAASKEAKLNKIAVELSKNLLDYAQVVSPDMAAEMANDPDFTDGSAMRELLDAIFGSIQALADLGLKLDNLDTHPLVSPVKNKKPKNADDVIADFLRDVVK